MISLEQIVLLESRVQKAVEKISTLHRENDDLKKILDEYETRIGELEAVVNRFKEDQGRIEQGILNALNQLDDIEDSVDEIRSDEPTAAGELPKPQARRPESDAGNPESESSIVFNEELIAEDEIVEEEDGGSEAPNGSIGSSPITSDSSSVDAGSSKEAELDIF